MVISFDHCIVYITLFMKLALSKEKKNSLTSKFKHPWLKPMMINLASIMGYNMPTRVYYLLTTCIKNTSVKMIFYIKTRVITKRCIWDIKKIYWNILYFKSLLQKKLFYECKQSRADDAHVFINNGRIPRKHNYKGTSCIDY